MQIDEQFQSYIPDNDSTAFALSTNSFIGENEMTLDGADYILGLGSKKKKAKKKVRKSERLLAKGNVAGAERKLRKAEKKAPIVELEQKFKDTAAKIEAKKIKDAPPPPSNIAAENLSNVPPLPQNQITPTTQDVAPQIGESTGAIGEMSSDPQIDLQDNPIDGGVMPNVTITNAPKSKLFTYLIIGAVALLIVFLILKSKKK